jgi:hypothetical protein
MTISASALLVISLVAGCGGSDGESEPMDTDAPSESNAPGESDDRNDLAEPDEPDQPTEADVPVQDVAADAAAAEASLLTLSDFPAGWSEVPAEDEDDSFEEMNERQRECLGTDADVLNEEVEARTGDFTNPDDDSAVTQVVSLAPSVEMAEAYMAGGSADGVAACLTAVYREGFAEAVKDAEEMRGAELGEITVGALNVGEIGEESFAYRVTVPVSIQGFTVDIVADLVAVRVGRSVSGLTFRAQFDPTPTERITEYSALAASRLPG